MSASESEDMATPLPGAQMMINGVPVETATPPPPPPLRERLKALRADFSTWLAGAPLAPGEIPGIDVFERDASEVMSRQHTARARKIARIAVFIIVALIVWAAFARVDEVTKGDGRVVPSRQLQVLQSLDGGVVERSEERRVGKECRP